MNGLFVHFSFIRIKYHLKYCRIVVQLKLHQFEPLEKINNAGNDIRHCPQTTSLTTFIYPLTILSISVYQSIFVNVSILLGKEIRSKFTNEFTLTYIVLSAIYIVVVT